jgi:hypothetical protein
LKSQNPKLGRLKILKESTELQVSMEINALSMMMVLMASLPSLMTKFKTWMVNKSLGRVLQVPTLVTGKHHPSAKVCIAEAAVEVPAIATKIVVTAAAAVPTEERAGKNALILPQMMHLTLKFMFRELHASAAKTTCEELSKSSVTSATSS